MFIARQGDVLVERIAAIPNDAMPTNVESERIILVRGEATGHHHSVPAQGVALLERTATDEKFLQIMRSVELTHQEHGAIVLEPGVYRVTRQREYAGSDMAPLPVVD